jgi:hypothetical protein
MLLVEDDPTKNIHVLKAYHRNLVVILKDATIYKNMLA